MKLNKSLIAVIFVSLFFIFIFACASAETVEDDTINLSDMSDEIFIEDEYYIGKGVAAKIFNNYAEPITKTNRDAGEYIRFIGATISAVSDSNEDIYKNYSFSMLNNDEKVTYALPSGFILLSKGIFTECKNEDELAGVIAYLVGLNVGKYAVNSIPKELKQKINYASEKEDEVMLNEVFVETVEFVYDYIANGYCKEAHLYADEKAVEYLFETGYSIEAYKNIVKTLSNSKFGFKGDNLPTIEERITVINETLNKLGESPTIKEERTERFEQILATLQN